MQPARCPYRGNASALLALKWVHNNTSLPVVLRVGTLCEVWLTKVVFFVSVVLILAEVVLISAEVVLILAEVVLISAEVVLILAEVVLL